MAGIVALSTKEKGNVIPGVAIATALMPPLCTAGFGLATGNLLYFLGAFYLYFINSVFISLATVIGVRVMHFQLKAFVDKEREKMVKRYIVLIALGTMIPAVYLTYGIVKETFYQSAANHFISKEMDFPDTQVLDRKVSYDTREIRVVLIGEEVSEDRIVEARSRLKDYKLNNTKLVVFQGINSNTADISNIRSMVMEDFYKNSEKELASQKQKIDSLEKIVQLHKETGMANMKIASEMKVLFPAVNTLAMTQTLKLNIEAVQTDTVTYVILGCEKKPSATEKKKMSEWLKTRTGAKKLKLIVE